MPTSSPSKRETALGLGGPQLRDDSEDCEDKPKVFHAAHPPEKEDDDSDSGYAHAISSFVFFKIGSHFVFFLLLWLLSRVALLNSFSRRGDRNRGLR